jgi:hypothetical protein
MRDGCSFPGCVAADFHDGEHDFARPYGAIRLVQVFEVLGFVMCDVCPEMPAKALYVDALGKGWLLCVCCEEEYSVRLEAA